MNIGRPILAVLFLLAGAARLHATPAFTFSSITYCHNSTPVATNQTPTIYTTVPDWYVGVATNGFTEPALMGSTRPRTDNYSGTQMMLHLDEGSGTTSADASGIGHIINPVDAKYNGNSCTDGTLSPTVATTTWVAGQANFGNALDYDGNYSAQCSCGFLCTTYAFSASYSLIQNLTTTFTNKSFSVEMWVANAGSPVNVSGTGDAPILQQCSATSTRNCLMLSIRNNRAYFGFWGDDLQGSVRSWVGWHHVAFTFDSASLTQTIYVDGTQDAQRTAGGAYTGNSGNTYLGIAPNWAPGNSFGGQMDDIRIINYEMTGSQVATDKIGQAYYYLQSGNPSYPGRWYPYYPSDGDNWSYGSPSARFKLWPGKRGLPATIGLGGNTNTIAFAAQDVNESKPLNYAMTVTVNQSDLMQPPQPTATSVGTSSITWSWSSYYCNSPYTTYNLTTNAGAPGAPNNSTSYSPGAAAPGLPGALVPNTLYNLSFTATYVDTGGSGSTVGPSGASPTTYTRTLAAAPTTQLDVNATGPTSVSIPMLIRPNPNGTLCQVWGKRNGSYVVVSPYLATNDGAVRSVTNLPKSSNYLFAINCRNDDGIVGPKGPDSAPAPTFVSQPATPSSFAGSVTPDPAICPKTAIAWSWTAVAQGGDYPTPSTADTPYRVRQMNGDGSLGGTMCTPPDGQNSCVEKNLLPDTNYSRVAQANDPLASWAPAVWSDTSPTANVMTRADYTDPPGAPSAVPGSNLIDWSWPAPTNICVSFEYRIHDAVTGAQLPNGTVGDMSVTGSYPAPNWTQLRDAGDNPLATNTLYSIMVVAQDTVSAPSALSASASAYTMADAPTNLRAAFLSTTSVLLQWDSTNPTYTRFEVSMSPVNDLGQPFSFSTLTYITNNWTQKSLQINSLDSGSTYYFRVRAANGRASDSYGGLLSGFAVLASTITGPAPPPLTGTGTSTATVSWTWSYVTGAAGYKLVSTGGTTILDDPDTTQTSLSSGPFLPNTACGARIAAYNSQAGLGPYSNAVYAFTLATTPVLTPGLNGIVSGSTSAVTISWTPNGNSDFTFYEIVLATDSAFGVVAATVSAQSTWTVIAGLFPGSTYYARLRAINGAQQMTNFVPAGSGGTAADPYVTRSSAPVSPYYVPPGLVGLWHLDEASGTWAGDSTPWRNSGRLLCQDIPAVCSAPSSTPAFTTDALPGLGNAVSFSGLRNTMLSIPDAAQYDAFSGSVTVGLWAKPASAVQPDGAALAAKGAWGAESFSLETALVSGAARWRFRAKLGGGGSAVVVSTMPARVGEWDHVVGVFDAGAAAQASLYVNGVFAGSATTGGLMRAVNAEPLTLGNRKDSGGAYNLGYSGLLDDLRLRNGALCAAEVAELYRSYIPNALVPSGVNSGIQLLLPPNAFESAANVYMSADPINHPLRITYSLLSQALARVPTGQLLIPPSQTFPTMVEIVPTLDGVNYYNGPLGSSAVLSMAYADVDGDRVVDGTRPPIPASRLQLYALESGVLTWTPLPTTIDLVSKRVSAPVPHFSVFALFGAAAFGQTISAARVYPVPWIPGGEDRFGGPALIFADLPRQGSIRILTLSGERVVDLPFTSADAGLKRWDGRNEAGRAAASGVYFARVESPEGSRILRFAIER
jgi:hypothetical protein